MEEKEDVKILIRTENICRTFRSGRETVYALKNVSLKIQQRKLVIIKGRSGSGKTTLMNIMGALDRPDSGSIYFNGSELNRLSENEKDALRRKRIGFVYQSVALISLMTAYENVEFALRVSGYNKRTRRKRAEDSLAMVGLQKRMHHRPDELSGGEQQRVAIARAMAHMPEVIFADEPTAELDTHLGLQVVKVLKSLVENEGMTVIMTTHDPNMTEIADCVYTLEDGEIVE